MKRQTFNRIIKAIAIMAVVAVMVIFIGHNYINTIEKRQTVVQIPKDTKETLFFYRDDCADCQSIFHQVYWQDKLTKQDVLFINMNQPANRKYIEKYHLTAVPTFINADNQRYSGTNLDKIEKVVGKN
ncbi:thioredoxin [Companilactobacillus farciminis]|nr:hypothetical protein Nizo2484_2126 [Lactiplantibacillus plantarum]KZU28687.1 hypothetical protein Nizo2485_0833 [Lactiplantibacillus plantarum]